MDKKVNRVPRFIAAVVTVGMGGYLITWSYFRDALGRLFTDWSQSQLSLPFSLHNVTVCLMMLFTGPLLLKLSSRVVLGFGGIAVMIGFGFFAFLPQDDPSAALVMATVGFGIIAAMSVGIGVIASFDTFLPWFPDHPGAVSGVLTFWCGVAPMLLGALCGVFIDLFGVLTAISLIGVVIGVAVLIATVWSKKPGSDVKLPPPPPKVEEALSKDYSPTQVLRTGTFWCVFIFNVTIRSAGLVVSDLGGSIAIALGVATIAGLMFAPANGLACILGGLLMDRFTVERVMTLMAAAAAGGGILLCLGNSAHNSFLVIAGIALVGFGYGGVTVTGVSGARILFGMKHYAQNLGLISVSIGPAAIAVILAGRLNTGGSEGYGGAFTLVTIFSFIALAACIAMFATERSRKSKLGASNKAAG
jgi:OFA family oxalate/formate antiporter-like MFS transporter